MFGLVLQEEDDMSRLLTIGIVQQKRKANLFLDLYPNASSAFSFRKLRDNYTGYCIKVLRSSDSATQDIGFVDGLLDETSLISFVGSGDGYILMWYDQSGNNYHCTSISDSYYLPQIISSGTVITLNGKVSCTFNGNKLLYESGSTNLGTFLSGTYQNSTFLVCSSASSSRGPILSGLQSGPTNRFTLYTPYTTAIYYDAGNQTTRRISVANPSGFADNQHLVSLYSTGSISYIKVDSIELKNANVSGDLDLDQGGVICIGTAFYSAEKFIGSIQEIIVYPSDKSSDISNIESNINSHYSIY